MIFLVLYIVFNAWLITGLCVSFWFSQINKDASKEELFNVVFYKWPLVLVSLVISKVERALKTNPASCLECKEKARSNRDMDSICCGTCGLQYKVEDLKKQGGNK